MTTNRTYGIFNFATHILIFSVSFFSQRISSQS